MIHSGKTTSIDVGCINDHHYFTGNVGGGILQMFLLILVMILKRV